MSDFIRIIMARIDPALVPALKPVMDDLRIEFGGMEVYIASPRAQRSIELREALRTESASSVAKRYRVSLRTAQRLSRQ